MNAKKFIYFIIITSFSKQKFNKHMYNCLLKYKFYKLLIEVISRMVLKCTQHEYLGFSQRKCEGIGKHFGFPLK